jgi:hypothetical protein
MEKMIAFCGLTCSECPAYIATQREDDDERRKVAEMWSKEFKVELKPEDINCDGCLDKKIKNCAYCDEYACEKLTDFFKVAPEAKNNLDEVRKSL